MATPPAAQLGITTGDAALAKRLQRKEYRLYMERQSATMALKQMKKIGRSGKSPAIGQRKITTMFFPKG